MEGKYEIIKKALIDIEVKLKLIDDVDNSDIQFYNIKRLMKKYTNLKYKLLHDGEIKKYQKLYYEKNKNS